MTVGSCGFNIHGNCGPSAIGDAEFGTLGDAGLKALGTTGFFTLNENRLSAFLNSRLFEEDLGSAERIPVDFQHMRIQLGGNISFNGGRNDHLVGGIDAGRQACPAFGVKLCEHVIEDQYGRLPVKAQKIEASQSQGECNRPGLAVTRESFHGHASELQAQVVAMSAHKIHSALNLLVAHPVESRKEATLLRFNITEITTARIIRVRPDCPINGGIEGEFEATMRIGDIVIGPGCGLAEE